MLVPIHPGVYLLGYATPPLAREAAAVLACQPRAFLSRLTAARLLRLPAPDPGAIEVTVVGRWRRSLRGVRVSAIARIEQPELRRHEGLPISSPSLTLLDLAGVLTGSGFRDALNEARVLRLVADDELRATLGAHPQRRGARALAAVLASERGPKLTRSEAERRALRVMRAHGIEPDAGDVEVGPYRADFLFKRERVIVEIDGYRYHATPKRFVGDRRRIAYLAARGYLVVPLTWDDFGPRADVAMADLRRTLELRRAEP
jgi:very-short-patch-repair endonuclease